MVVDDEQDSLRVMRHLFEQEGLIVTCAESGEEALLAIQERSFALIVTDLYMTGINGMELARKVKEFAPHLPIIMTTGDYSPEILKMTADAGITKVLAKPFHPLKMIETVRRVMEEARGEQEELKIADCLG